MNYLDKAEKALQHLADTEKELARLKGLLKVAPDRIKIVLAKEIMRSPESSQAAKKAWAEAGEPYEKAVDEYQGIVDMYTACEERRKRAELTIEMYRSVNSALKRGNMT